MLVGGATHTLAQSRSMPFRPPHPQPGIRKIQHLDGLLFTQRGQRFAQPIHRHRLSSLPPSLPPSLPLSQPAVQV